MSGDSRFDMRQRLFPHSLDLHFRPPSYTQTYKHLLINRLVFNELRFICSAGSDFLLLYQVTQHTDVRRPYTTHPHDHHREQAASQSANASPAHALPVSTVSTDLTLTSAIPECLSRNNSSEEEAVHNAMTASASNIIRSKSAYEIIGQGGVICRACASSANA